MAVTGVRDLKTVIMLSTAKRTTGFPPETADFNSNVNDTLLGNA